MNPALLGPALAVVVTIYSLVRGVRILKTGAATMADAFPFGGLLFFWVLGSIRLRGWSARLAAFPHLIVGLVAVVGLGFMAVTSVGRDQKGKAAATREPAAATAVAQGPGWLDRISASLASLTRKPASQPAKPSTPSQQAPTMPEPVRELTETEFPYFTKAPDKLAVVLFYRDGDGPSRMVQQELEGVSLEFTGRVEITRVNIERFPKLAEQQDIRGVPDIRFFRNGKRVDQVTGPAPTEMLRMRFQQLAPAPPAPVVAVAEPVAAIPSGSGSITRMKKGWMPAGVQRR